MSDDESGISSYEARLIREAAHLPSAKTILLGGGRNDAPRPGSLHHERLEVRLLLPERRGTRAARATLRGRHERRCQRTEEWRTMGASSQSSRTPTLYAFTSRRRGYRASTPYPVLAR